MGQVDVIVGKQTLPSEVQNPPTDISSKVVSDKGEEVKSAGSDYADKQLESSNR